MDNFPRGLSFVGAILGGFFGICFLQPDVSASVYPKVYSETYIIMQFAQGEGWATEMTTDDYKSAVLIRDSMRSVGSYDHTNEPVTIFTEIR